MLLCRLCVGTFVGDALPSTPSDARADGQDATKLATYVVAAGLLYGEGEALFHQYFKVTAAQPPPAPPRSAICVQFCFFCGLILLPHLSLADSLAAVRTAFGDLRLWRERLAMHPRARSGRVRHDSLSLSHPPHPPSLNIITFPPKHSMSLFCPVLIR